MVCQSALAMADVLRRSVRERLLGVEMEVDALVDLNRNRMYSVLALCFRWWSGGNVHGMGVSSSAMLRLRDSPTSGAF